jgi:hypothetical protein
VVSSVVCVLEVLGVEEAVLLGVEDVVLGVVAAYVRSCEVEVDVSVLVALC